jgi:GNAT superfamily N-acetyltransferase
VHATDFLVSVHDDLPAEAVRLIDEGLGQANASAAPLHEVVPLACFARAAKRAVLGGAVGRTWGACCELQQLWVAPGHRGQGLGSLLVRRFEERAASRGCRTFFLETFSFQAPALYERLGYRPRLVLQGFGAGIVKYVMVREEKVRKARIGAGRMSARIR